MSAWLNAGSLVVTDYREKGGRDEERQEKQLVSTGGRSAQLQSPCSSYHVTVNLLALSGESLKSPES